MDSILTKETKEGVKEQRRFLEGIIGVQVGLLVSR